MHSPKDLFELSSDEVYLHIPYLLLIGILYCKSTTKERATKMYHLCQMDLTPHVSSSDRELKDYFYKLCEISTLTISELFT